MTAGEPGASGRLARRGAAMAALIAVGAVLVVALGSGPEKGARRTVDAPSAAPTDPLAHLWVDKTGGACERAEQPRVQALGVACGSFAEAYAAALPGDIVLVAAGTFPGQQLVADPTKTGEAPVTFAAVPGQRVRLRDTSPDGHSLQLGRADATEPPPDDLVFRDLALVDEFYVYPGTRRVAFEGITARKFFIRCGSAITIAGGDFSDERATAVPTISGPAGLRRHRSALDRCGDDAAPSRDIVIERTRFHRIWRPRGSADHRECLHVQGVDGLVVRGSRFEECLGNTAAISVNADPSDSPIDGVLIEGNRFWRTYRDGDCCPGPSGEGPALNLSADAEGYDVTFRDNRLLETGGIVAQAAPGPSGILVEANELETAPTCALAAPDYVWRDNVARAGEWDADCDDGGNRVEPAAQD
jgi:hypothetical protein